jgi:peptidoglycan/LPS O-acetylase OafA/YrhL
VLLGIVLVGSDWRVSFGDYPNEYFAAFPPMLNQAWTLGAELSFYLLAPFLFRSTKICLAVLVLSVAIRAYLVHRYGFDSSWTYHFFPAALMFFLLGHISRKICTKLNLGQWSLLFTVPFIVFAWLGLGSTSFDSVYFYLYVVSMMLFMPQLFEITKDSKVLNFLGDISYSVYLSHIIVLVLFQPYAIGGVGGALLYCAICIAVGTLLHRVVERPLSLAIKHVFTRRVVALPQSQ